MRRGAEGARADFQAYVDARGNSISAQRDVWAVPETTNFKNGSKPPPFFWARLTGQEREGVLPQISGRTIRALWIGLLIARQKGKKEGKRWGRRAPGENKN